MSQEEEEEEEEDSTERDQTDNGWTDNTILSELCCVPTTLELPSVLTAAQLLALRERKLLEKKELIADLASRLVEDPEENVCLAVLLMCSPYLSLTHPPPSLLLTRFYC